MSLCRPSPYSGLLKTQVSNASELNGAEGHAIYNQEPLLRFFRILMQNLCSPGKAGELNIQELYVMFLTEMIEPCA